MNETKDITTIADIKQLVDSFYSKVRIDLLLGGIFNGVIKDRWPEHLEKMYRFWETILLEQHTYYGSPFRPHAMLPVERLHFDAWLKLWYETIDEHFTGTKAKEAKWRGEKMAAMFLTKIKYRSNCSTNPLL